MKSCAICYAGYLAVALIAACAKNYMPPFLEITWMVVDHKAPGISAMDADQADSQLGKIASYDRAKARRS